MWAKLDVLHIADGGGEIASDLPHSRPVPRDAVRLLDRQRHRYTHTHEQAAGALSMHA